MPQRRTTLFEDAIDVPIWLEADRRLPLAERTRRDREIGQALAGGNARTRRNALAGAQLLSRAGAVARVREWWRRVDAAAPDLPGRRLEHARQWLNVGVTLLGILGGASLALAAYRYDGTVPVNVVRVLGLLVAPQLVLLVLSLLLLPGRLPVLGRLQDALAAINPGAIVGSIYRQLTKRAEASVFGWVQAGSSAARRFAKWQMICWSQIAAVWFNAAAIATAAILIAFTDLAFGWSTTLAIDAETATRVFAAIATPWSQWAGAVPDAALVERSQFFRLEGGGSLDGSEPRALTAWWPFTILAIVVYGLIPRLAFLGLGIWRLRAATRALLLENATVTALLDRLSAPAIETRGTAHAEPERPLPRAAPRVARPALGGAAAAVIWAQSTEPDAAAALARERLGVVLGTIAEAGGGRSLEADRAALTTLDGAQAVLVFTPAWEPPLLEFGDFLAALRERIGAQASIVVVPVGEAGSAISALERETWERAVRRATDARAYVETGDA